MIQLKFTIVEQSLVLITDTKGLVVPSDSINNIQCDFVFDDTWNDYVKRVYFKNASYNVVESVLLDDSDICFIPWECLAHTGVIMCTIVGSQGDTKGLISRLTTNTIPILLQREEATLQSTFDPTGTEIEQLLATLELMKGKLESIEEGAEVNVQSDWDQIDILADDYVKNKPQIEGVTLEGNKTYEQLNLERVTNSEMEEIFRF